MVIYGLENPAFAALVKYGSVVLFKFISMSPLTSIYRKITGCPGTAEDVHFFASVSEKEKVKKMLDNAARNPSMIRVRAAHMNDIENIVPFFLIAMLYLSINPDPATAAFLFKTFAISRVLHTIVYLAKIPQPARATTWLVGFVINNYMLYKSLMHTW